MVSNFIGRFISLEDDIKFKFNIISSANVGLTTGYFTKFLMEKNMPKFHILSCDMPFYARDIFHDMREINYHICGYDRNFHQALTRMCGEVVERYAGVSAFSLIAPEKIVVASYAELKKQGKAVLDLAYINVFSPAIKSLLAQNLHEFAHENITAMTKIHWVAIYSLFANKEVYIPAQLFFAGFPAHKYQEQRYIVTMSTGTACHVNITKATNAAIMETIQINAFNHNWYFGALAKKVIIDDEALSQELALVMEDVTNVDLAFYLYEEQAMGLVIVGCYVIDNNGEFPAIAFGIQASHLKAEAFMRAALEALSVYVSNFYLQLFGNKNNKQSQQSLPESNSYFDLDKNVAFFASKANFAANRAAIAHRCAGTIAYSQISDISTEISNDNELLRFLTKQLQTHNCDLYLMDITPLEVKEHYAVMRILIPQLLPVFLPSAPYNNHPRVQGKPFDDYIHPLA